MTYLAYPYFNVSPNWNEPKIRKTWKELYTVKILVVAGRMGTGKDSVADQLLGYGWQRVALADVLKQYCHKIFGFDEETLFGPSAARNRIVQPGEISWTDVFYRAGRIVEELSVTMMAGSRVLTDDTDRNHLTQNIVADAFCVFLNDCYAQDQKGTFSARYALQKLGTEFGRSLRPNAWLVHAESVIHDIEMGYRYSPLTGVDWLNGCGVDGNVKPVGYVITDCRFPNEAEFFKKMGAKVVWIDASKRVPKPENRHASEPDEKDFEGLTDDTINNNGSILDLAEEVRRVTA